MASGLAASRAAQRSVSPRRNRRTLTGVDGGGDGPETAPPHEHDCQHGDAHQEQQPHQAVEDHSDDLEAAEQPGLRTGVVCGAQGVGGGGVGGGRSDAGLWGWGSWLGVMHALGLMVPHARLCKGAVCASQQCAACRAGACTRRADCLASPSPLPHAPISQPRSSVRTRDSSSAKPTITLEPMARATTTVVIVVYSHLDCVCVCVG